MLSVQTVKFVWPGMVQYHQKEEERQEGKDHDSEISGQVAIKEQ